MSYKDCLEFRARDIFFRKLRVTTCEIRTVFVHFHTFVFFTLALTTFLVFDALNLMNKMAIWQAAFIWIIAILSQASIILLLTLAWAWGQDRFFLPVIYMPILNLCTLLLTFPLTVLHIGLHSGHSYAEVFHPGIFISGVLFCLVFEALYFAFVNPLILQSIAQRTGREARAITIAGESFEINKIYTLRGQEHYVLVDTETGNHRLRARLSDLVSQTNVEDGVLAHRSYWVGRQAIARLEAMNGSDVILTHSGEQLPVARPRKHEVRGWMAQHAPHAMPPGENYETD